jgi:hypothetical protein
MAISPDVLATALQEQLPGYSELFTSWHPLFEKMMKKGGIESGTLQGPYREFVVVNDGPGQVSQVNTGSEVIAGGRTQASYRGNEYGTRMIYAFDVPAKDLAEANGEQDLAKILQKYPELGLSHFHELLSRQLATGDGAGVGGWFTLNGNTTYSPNGTARNGLIEFAAPSSQTNTVHGLDPATVTGWANQYKHHSAAFSQGGRKAMRELFYKVQRQSANVIGPVDCGFADEASYLNYIDDLDDYVRIVDKTTEKLGDMAPDNVRQGVKFETCTIWLEDDIDIAASAYTGSTASSGHVDGGGVIYFIPSGVMKMFLLGHSSDKETKGFFDARGPFRIPDQDMWRYEFVLHGNIHTISRRHVGAITGTAT